MKVGDLVRFRSPANGTPQRGCLPYTTDDWGCGLIQEVVSPDGNVNVLWPAHGVRLTDSRFLEVINESR